MCDFYDIANTLLNKRVLLIKDKEYNLCEIEIYLYSEDHPDVYTHCHPDQLSQGNFYFHKASTKKGAKYRSGTFKGVDLTYGCNHHEDGKDSKVYCGILIRSILSSDNELITGPCKVVNHILSQYNVESIDELVDSGCD